MLPFRYSAETLNTPYKKDYPRLDQIVRRMESAMENQNETYRHAFTALVFITIQFPAFAAPDDR